MIRNSRKGMRHQDGYNDNQILHRPGNLISCPVNAVLALYIALRRRSLAQARQQGCKNSKYIASNGLIPN
jgi:hypothetical protein